MPQIVLGTAQLGLKYGVSNRTGKPSVDESVKIIKTAWENGVHFFDTAQDYGSSEEVLGEAFVRLKLTKQVKVISKTTERQPDIIKSLKRLKIDSLYGFLLHNEKQLDLWDEYLPIFKESKRQRLIRYAGISIYSSDYAKRALLNSGVDIVGLPFNVFDQRALTEKWFDLAKKNGKQIFVRSVYLQGLLLMNLDKLPPKMGFAATALRNYQDFCLQLNMTQQEVALAFVLQYAGNSKIIIGAETSRQVKDNTRKITKLSKLKLPKDILSLSQTDRRIINPQLW